MDSYALSLVFKSCTLVPPYTSIAELLLPCHCAATAVDYRRQLPISRHRHRGPPVTWTSLEAVHSLIKLIDEMVREIESERPLVGQCLPLCDELRSKIQGWCSNLSVEDGSVKKVVDKRFRINYHPAWSMVFILNPLYLIKDASGKYLPPFKYLTLEQEKDVDKLITRLVSREEAHNVLMELMKWRSEGLDPLYAKAV